MKAKPAAKPVTSKLVYDDLGTEWRTITEWPQYQVSRDGRIRRDGQVRKLQIMPSGHRFVRLLASGRPTRAYRVASLVAAAFLPPQPTASAFVWHRDGDRANNHADNLTWHPGPDHVGELNRNAKLTVSEVLAIRAAMQDGNAAKAVAERFRVAIATVVLIHKRKLWRSVPDDQEY